MYAATGGVDIEEGPPPARYPVGPPWKFSVHAAPQGPARGRTRLSVARESDRDGAGLVRAAAMHDCSTIEINPLAKLADGSLIAADAKVARDEWAHFRNAQIRGMREADRAARRPASSRESRDGAHVRRLDGDIGLISGGAGMTMAAMDMIAEQGGSPACFLDASPAPRPHAATVRRWRCSMPIRR